MENSSTPCPRHPASAATFACARCGTFACEACRSPEQATLCTTCTGRYASAGLPVGDTFQEAYRFLLRHSQAVVAYAAAQAAFGLVTLPLSLRVQAEPEAGENPLRALVEKWPSMVGIIVGSMLFTAVAYALFIRYVGDRLEGQERPFGELSQEALGRVPAMIGMNLLMGLAVGVGTVLCIVPGIFVGLALALSPVAVVLQSAGPAEALSVSWEKTQGHRVELALVLLLAVLVLIGVGIAGGIASALFALLGQVGVVLGTLVTQALSGAGISLMLTVLVFSYLRLSGRWVPGSAAR